MTLDPGVYRYPRSQGTYRSNAGGPTYTLMGPAVCQSCREHVWYAHSHTRDGWNGPTVRGLLRWRDKGGAIHKCDPGQHRTVRW